ncbi:mpv17-like protein [Arctopsyche grandis]|uniref:mpv17-like protein n=1 Tax=Arctopsyche grandis TaxID=121162 RepID=UPI00406DA04F
MALSKLGKFAKTMFQKHPLITNSFVYGVLYVGAEFSQQTLTRKVLVITNTPKEYDFGTVGRYAVMGTTLYAPILFTWYRWLDKKYVGTTAKIIVKKLLLDQFVITPPLLVIFFVGMSIMEQKKNYFEECKNKLIPTFQTSCMFWLPAQTLNFMLVPPAFRVIYVGSCAFVWINILCWIKRQKY